MPPRPRVRIFTYLALVFLFSSVFYLLCFRHGMKAAYVFGLMWCPAVAAILTCVLTKRPWHEFGWRLGKLKYLLTGWAFPLLYIWPAYLLVWATGVGGFPEAHQVEKIRGILHMPSAPTWAPLTLYYLIGSVAAVLFSCIWVAGEEIGWRGFLVPELIKVTSFTRTALISGVIWTAWHAPLIIWSHYNSGTPVWYSLACFATLTIAASFVFVWLTIKSGSLWPAVLLHASNNAMIEGYFSPLTVERIRTKYFAGEFGCAMLPFIVFYAWVVWKNFTETNGRGVESATPV